ncbi:MAG: PQQ-dependent sugar dehydrogenase [Candidatus Kapaibacteriales bacterium]
MKQLLKVADILEWGEGGLLGMAIHPDYPITPHLYLIYNYSSFNDYKGKVVRFRFENDTLLEPVNVLDNI